MFCEKCGNQLHEGDAFCEKCGAPVAQAGGEQAPAQPTVEQAAPQADVQPKVETPQPEAGAQMGQNNPQPVYAASYQAPVQAAPKVKKPFPKKLVIICAAAAVVIAGVIIALCILIPNLNKLEVKEYIKVELDESCLYNGYAKADISIDESSIEIDRLTDGDSSSESSDDYDLSDYLDNLSDYSNLYSAGQAVSEILDYVTISAYEKEAGTSTAVSSSDSDSSYYSYVELSNLDKDDVIVVNIKWDKSDSAQKSISKLEGEAGFKFDQSDATVEIKVSDVLSDKNLELQDVHNVDIVSYIKENDLVRTTGLEDGEYSVDIGSFSYTVGDYTVQYDSDSSYGYGVDIVDEYETTVETVYLEFSKNSGLSVGSKFTISTTQDLIEEASILVAETTEEFTVTENKVMTSDEAKSNIDAITKTVEEYIENQYYNRLSDYSAAEVYYVTPKSSSSSAEAYVIVIEKGKYDSYFTDYDTYYCAYCMENPYMIGDSLYFSGISSSSGDEKLADCKEASGYFETKNYTATKIN